ncbi:MAG: hypothetical protein II949_09110 [Prevotella sp.]|nr:hypothetical protein [Prevotella sp.]
MRKRFFLLTNAVLAALISLFTLGSCKHSNQEIEDVYGPPPYEEEADSVS